MITRDQALAEYGRIRREITELDGRQAAPHSGWDQLFTTPAPAMTAAERVSRTHRLVKDLEALSAACGIPG